VKVIGHTDSDGSADSNLALSKKRAEAVKKILSAEFGVPEASMQTDGKGAASPVGDNKTSTGKAQNRRVEFVKL
ncbi:MAG: OmpA family protein, partial [Chitinophagaceae bacterium]